MARSRALRNWALVFGAWTLLALLFSSQHLLYGRLEGGNIEWNRVAQAFCGIYTWALLTPVVFWICSRYPLGRARWQRNLGVHFGAMIVLVAIDIGVFILLDHFLLHGISWQKQLPLSQKWVRVVLSSFGFSVFWYWGVAGISHAVTFYRMYRERELTASHLETRLAHARLQLLKMQLQPHFLFNTLHTISALVNEDSRGADRMITRLSDLLRLTLENAGEQEVPLKQELELLQPYLEIEQTRFQDRLSVSLDIDPETLDARVPNLVLQPLVENAIRHGIAPRSAPGLIEIRSRREDGALHLEIRDNGDGLARQGKGLQEGLGLGNTRARLWQLYGDAQQLELKQNVDGGLIVRMIIPYRPMAEREGKIA
jgi:two-component system LytT family sensor kinase